MTQPAQADVTLPNGYWHQGVCLRQARVKAISEVDASFSDDLAASAPPIARASALLQRCVTHLGGREFEDIEQVRNLALGDREALLLQVRRLTFGDDIDCTLPCPSCSEPMSFQLRAQQLLVPGVERPSQYQEESFLADGTRWRVRFRVPQASDVEAAIRRPGARPDDEVMAMLDRCIEWVHRDDGIGGESKVPSAQWPAGLITQVSARTSELDPQAEITLQLECPSCGHGWSAPFDIADYFLRELAACERRLFYDVHRLALAYHWSEADILNMTARKRTMYLELLEGENASE